MSGSFLFVLAVVWFATVFNLMLFGWIANRFLSERESKIAGSSFVLGGIVAGGQISGWKLQWPNGSDDVAALLGGALGIAFVGFQFFRKEGVHG